MPNTIDLTGQKYGYLLAIKRVGTSKDGRPLWLFNCKCGNKPIINSKDVRSGHSKSCGCLAKELLTKRNLKHGQAFRHKASPEYRSWLGMRTRILDPTYHYYEHYKKRGIKICERWLNTEDGFSNFLKDMGKRPIGTSLDRENNEGNYEPGNCRWATHKQQMNNTSFNKLITFNGETLNQTQWAEKLKLPNSNIILKRLKRGWSLEKTLTTPLKKFSKGKWY